MKNSLIIIGGGAAGMMAAISAAREGASVKLLEKMDRPGRKLSITGKGRCNLTNTAPLQAFLEQTGPDSRFLRNVFTRFFSQDVLDFFHELGIQTETERGGRVFPAGGSALEVVAALKSEMLRRKVVVVPRCPVQNIRIRPEGGFYIETPTGTLAAPVIILATGGRSYPGTGSDGDGYTLASGLGHTLVTPCPALVPCVTAGNTAPRMQGLSLRNINASVWIDGKKQGEEFGELLFTHFGLSGPVILTLSRKFNREVISGGKVEVSIDLKPALDVDTLDKRIQRDLSAHGKMQIRGILKGLLPSGMIPVCVDMLGLDAEKQAHQITSAERNRLVYWMKDFRFRVTGLGGFAEAIVTAGGISTREIDPRTLASRVVPGLYLAGEIMDLDANTGGYNLQIAFSTGWVAGQEAARKMIVRDKD